MNHVNPTLTASASKRNLIFDLGGVLINYDLPADTRALAAVGLPRYSEWDRHPQLRQVCDAYLNGLLPEDEFCPRLRPFARPEATDQELLWSMIAVMGDLPKSRLDALVQLRQQHRLILLSNINERTWRYALQQFHQAGYEPQDCFDHLFLSYQMGVAKPDAEIYRAVMRQTGIAPADTLFLDDTQANIETARNLGIESWLVPMNQPEDLLSRLLNAK